MFKAISKLLKRGANPSMLLPAFRIESFKKGLGSVSRHVLDMLGNFNGLCANGSSITLSFFG
jgi:hypothetical protein